MKRWVEYCFAVALMSMPLSGFRATDSNNENAGLLAQLKDGCEIIARVGKEQNKCIMKIQVKNDFESMVTSDVESLIRGRYYEIEKAISITLSNECCFEDCAPTKKCLRKGDAIIYRKFKGQQNAEDAYHCSKLFVRAMKVDGSEMILNDITYKGFFQVAEDLLHQEETKLGKINIVVKKREFKKIPNGVFLLNPPRPKHRFI